MNNSQTATVAALATRQTTTLLLEEALNVERYNYRQFTTADQKELKAFADRLSLEGQLTPIRIAILSEEALQHEQLKALCTTENHLLIDGERRLLAMNMAHLTDNKLFTMVDVEFIPVTSLPHFLSLQIAFNMDRKNTSFVEDGIAFKRYIEHGGKKRDLLSSIQFPSGINSRKARLQYITERIDLVALHPNLHPFLNNGVLKSYKSKPHQGYLVMGFEEEMQEALAKEFEQVPIPKSDDSLLGFFDRFRVSFDKETAPFDSTNEELSIKEFGTKACTNCRYLKIIQERGWRDEVVEETYCYNSKCYETKKEKQIALLSAQLREQQIPFVLLNEQHDNGWGGRAAEEELEDGQKMIRYYEIVKEGSCPHTIAGVPDGSYNSQSLPKGKVLHVCPAKSKCTIHHPQKKQRQEAKRSERLVHERQKTEKETRLLSAIEWGKLLLQKESSPILQQLQEQFFLYGFEALYRASSSDVMNTFTILMEIPKEEYFETYPIKRLIKSLEKYGKEKCWQALLLAYLFHDYDQHWKLIEQWGEKSKIDFTKIYQANLDLSMEDLHTKHQKRQQGWEQQEQTLRNKIHALYFKLPYQVGIWNWKSKKHLMKVLADETKGRKACRLVGVSLKDIPVYNPELILQKLRGRKAELDTLFPEFQLTDQESQFLTIHKKVYQQKMKDFIPFQLGTRTDSLATFLKVCIEKANELGKPIATAELIVAILSKQTITLPILHTTTKAIILQMGKEQELLDRLKIDKSKKQIHL